MNQFWSPGSPNDILSRSNSFSLPNSEQKGYSQNGEDGVIFEIISRIGLIKKGSVVEFGVQDGRETCSRLLVEHLGWHGLYIESNEKFYKGLQMRYLKKKKITAVHEHVSSKNINSIINQHSRQSPNIIIIDVDGLDYQIFKAISAKPELFVIEYNGSLPLEDSLVCTRETWDGTANFGASLGALESIANNRGYSLVHTSHPGVNAFFIRNDLLHLFPEHKAPKKRKATYGANGNGHPGLDMSNFIRY